MRGKVGMKQIRGAAVAAVAIGCVALAAPAHAQDVLAQARARIAASVAPVTTWDGPTSGPKAQPGKTVIYISADQRNGGALGVGNGVVEAGAAIGWTVKVIDGQGSVPQQTAAIGQAMALRPDGIILGTIDAAGQRSTLDQAIELGIKVVGWHSSPKPGPMDSPKLFANITTPPEDIAITAADYAIAQSDGRAQVAIMRNSETLIGRTKGDLMRKRIEECAGCKVLSFDVIPIVETSTRVTPLTASLMQRFNGQLTWMLAINDLYFDFAIPALRSAGVPPSGPPLLVSGGDGSVSAYGRIKEGSYQAATVPEPLNLHGWMAIDELNRAMAGAPWSGYVTKVHLVTHDNVLKDGGENNRFDPDNGYRDAYKKIWGVK
jgi:ribose transport system substrate-binding protein